MRQVDLPLVMIAAVARNGVIGRGNAMPWRLPGDLAHFRAATLGKPVIMGRKTFEAIGAPLPGRRTVVMTRDPVFHATGVDCASTADEAVARAQDLGRQDGSDSIMVAGGATIYAALMPRAATLLVTEVDLQVDGDALFPPIDPAMWVVADRVAAALRPGDEAPYRFVRYSRRP